MVGVLQNLSVQIDGQTVPVLLGDNHAAVAPPVLSGAAVGGNNQIVLGPGSLALLHKHISPACLCFPLEHPTPPRSTCLRRR